MKKIFIVDDDIINLKMGKNALSDHFDVFALDSGQAMLDMLENILPDLILLDINMPEMDGYTALKLLKANKKATDIPVIFVTAQGDIGSVLEGISGGINDYVVKPFEPALLLERVNAQLDLAE
jgi:putative two-component system response regulator